MLGHLTDREVELIRRTIIAAAAHLDWDYQTRMGIEKHDTQQILASWPPVADDESGSDVEVLITSSLNDVLNGMGLSDLEVQRHIGCNRTKLSALFRKWRGER